MANELTQILNFVEPTSFADYSFEKATTKNLLLLSGAMVRTAQMDQYASGSGRTVHLPFISNFDHVESDLANDTTAVPDASKYVGLETKAQIDRRTKSWSAAKLASSVAGVDFIEAAASNVGNYLADDLNARVMSKIKGYLNENATAPGGGDLHTQNDAIYKIGTDAAGAVADAQRASYEAIIEAASKMGDSANNLAIILMHSRVFADLMKIDKANVQRPSATDPFGYFYGMRVLIDDSVPVSQGTNRKLYTTLLLGNGAIAYGVGTPDKGAIQVISNDDQGGAWGVDKLVARTQDITQINGCDSNAVVSANMACPSYAQYEATGAILRKVDLKNVPIIALQTNGGA